MTSMFLLWFKQRLRLVATVGTTLLALLIVWLVVSDGAGLGVDFLGNSVAPRASSAPATGMVLPRSGDPNAPISTLPGSDQNASLLDAPVNAGSGPQDVAAAQAAWSADEVRRHQNEILAAVNCARQAQDQPALALDPALSTTAGEAWLKLVRNRSWSLANLPGRYELRSVLALDFDRSSPAAQTSQDAQQGQEAPRCAIGGFDAVTLPATRGVASIGIGVFPPQASWDNASAVVLVK